jgi:hypothetical protein
MNESAAALIRYMSTKEKAAGEVCRMVSHTMDLSSMNKNKIKWAAELSGVHEVSLLGAANLSYWTKHLAQEGLRPLEKDGRAQVLMIAADARFMGLRFQEMSFCVLASADEFDSSRQEAFLVHAFNSRRFFAFSERAIFSTPYYCGDVRLSAKVPAWIEVADAGMVLFRAEMQRGDARARQREPLRSADDGWEGPVYLPTRQDWSDRRRRMFFARIKGDTKSYAFLQHEDSCLIRPAHKHPVLEALIASQFAPTEWIIRENAMHAKSKTYRTTDLISV